MGGLAINTGDTAFVLISGALVCSDDAGPGLLLRRAGAAKERPRDHDAELHRDGRGHRHLGAGRLQPGLRPRTPSAGCHRQLELLRPQRRRRHWPTGLTGRPSLSWAFFGYQEMFAIITPALITGAFADRVKFKSYLWFLVLWSIIVYIPFVHWIWGGGWLAQHGVLDFAGGAGRAHERRLSPPWPRSSSSVRIAPIGRMGRGDPHLARHTSGLRVRFADVLP